MSVWSRAVAVTGLFRGDNKMNQDAQDAWQVLFVAVMAGMLVVVSVIVMCACVQYDNSPDNTCRAADNFRKIPCDFYRGGE